MVVAASAAAAGFAVFARRSVGGHDVITATAIQIIGALPITVPLLAVEFLGDGSRLDTANAGHLPASSRHRVIASRASAAG